MNDNLMQLSIATTVDGRGEAFIFHLRLGNTIIASNQVLTSEQSQRARGLSKEYGVLFERPQPPKATEEALAAIGSDMFSIWLAPFWAKLTADTTLGDSRELVIGSSCAEVLNTCLGSCYASPAAMQ